MAKLRARNSTQELIERVCSQPTAPFREGWARGAIETILAENAVPYFHDAAGNLIAGARSRAELRSVKLALFAHMDHPGFHLGERVRGDVWRCYWYGGGPFQFMPGAKVRVYDPLQPGRSINGRIQRLESEDHDKDGIPFLVEFPKQAEKFSQQSFGTFAFPKLNVRNGIASMPAADDLAGCVIALGCMLDQEIHKTKAKPRETVAIFTRGEEVGFIGCLDFLQKKILPKNVCCISLEASKALPEAEVGKGPVLRIGDKATLFNSDFSAMLLRLAQDLQAEDRKAGKEFLFQRRLMSGGTCEATPLTIYSYTVTAIAVPLLNYHNIARGRPAPEKIAVDDADGARRLCFELGRRLERLRVQRQRARKNIFSHFSDFKQHLKTDIRYDSRQENAK